MPNPIGYKINHILLYFHVVDYHHGPYNKERKKKKKTGIRVRRRNETCGQGYEDDETKQIRVLYVPSCVAVDPPPKYFFFGYEAA